MGPNVKFVSAITDAFSNKKWGSEGGLVKDHTFAAFFLCTLPLERTGPIDLTPGTPGSKKIQLNIFSIFHRYSMLHEKRHLRWK